MMQPNQPITDSLVEQILPLIETGKLPLPTLPSVAQEILQANKGDNLTTESLGHLIEQDPAITAHLIKIANSPLVGCSTEVTDLKTAIGLFGVLYCSQLAISLALKQLFRARHSVVAELIQKTWEDCSQVAGLCLVMAKSYSINPGSAYLAGLLHKIGALPILRWLDEQPELALSHAEIWQLLEQHQGNLAEQLLDDWCFPTALCAIPHTYNNLNFSGHQNDQSQASSADLVAAAYHFVSSPSDTQWPDGAVLDRLGLTPDEMPEKMQHWQSLTG